MEKVAYSAVFRIFQRERYNPHIYSIYKNNHLPKGVWRHLEISTTKIVAIFGSYRPKYRVFEGKIKGTKSAISALHRNVQGHNFVDINFHELKNPKKERGQPPLSFLHKHGS